MDDRGTWRYCPSAMGMSSVGLVWNKEALFNAKSALASGSST